MLKRLKALLQRKKEDDQFYYFSLGTLTAIALSFGSPLFPIAIFFVVGIVALLGLGLALAYYKNFMNLRMLFLGASLASVVSAFVTFIGLNKNGLIQITHLEIAGIFKSLLLASTFSLLERVSRFLEDRAEKKA